jgi:hypothetical protein
VGFSPLRFRKNLKVLAVDGIVIVQKPIASGLHLASDLSQRAGKYTLAGASVDRSFGRAYHQNVTEDSGWTITSKISRSSIIFNALSQKNIYCTS